MTPKFLSLSNKHIRWLLPAGLLLFLVLGFLQTPEVQTRVNQDFLWKDQLFRMHKEGEHADNKLKQVEGALARLKPGEQPGERKLRQLKKTINSVITSLYFLDAMSATLSGELQAELSQATPARRAQLLAYLQELKTLKLSCGEYQRRLQAVYPKVYH